MPARSIADLLPDFGNRTDRGPARPVELRAARPAPSPDPQPAADISSMISEEVAKAEAAVTERLSALYEATLEAERKSHAEERDELRRNLGAETAALIESRFAEAEERLLMLTTTAAARILGGILTEEIRKRAIAALSARIRDAVADRDAIRVRVYGPQLLCQAIETSLGAHASSVEFIERSSLDAAVHIEGSIYETRLAEWSAELAGVLA